MELWVAYITKGRDKYEYETNFIGVFADVCAAARATYTRLVEQGHLFCYDEEENQVIRQQCMERLDEATPLDVLNVLRETVKLGEDSYYRDGWDYTVKKVQVVQ